MLRASVETIKVKSTWLQRGKQRSAVARVLLHPMTGSEILERARSFAPRMHLRDVWFALRELSVQELVYCLNPELGNGKVFFLTDLGREVVKPAFGNSVTALPADLDWDCVGKVARARIRRSVLEEISKPSPYGLPGKCASEIRKNLLERRPMELSRAIRALGELSGFKLIRVAGYTPKPKKKLYQLTTAGRRVVEILKRSQDNDPCLGKKDARTVC